VGYCSGNKKAEHLNKHGLLATELVNLNVDLLVAQGGAPTVALHRATSTIPIVFSGVADPVAQGFVSSISKPGRNMSGMSQMSPDVSSKRLQFLQKAIPALSQVALVGDPTNTGNPLEMAQLSSAAGELGLSCQVFDASTRSDIDQIFQRMEEQHFVAAVVGAANFLSSERKQISALGLRHRIALMGPFKYFVEDGSLFSYGVDIPTLWHGAAHIVDKVLRGENIGDIPVQLPTKLVRQQNLWVVSGSGNLPRA
jgi:putative ABC transport system substrate-binding protein